MRLPSNFGKGLKRRFRESRFYRREKHEADSEGAANAPGTRAPSCRPLSRSRALSECLTKSQDNGAEGIVNLVLRADLQ